MLIDAIDEDDADEDEDAFTWRASGREVASQVPAGRVLAAANEAGDLALNGAGAAAAEAFDRVGQLAVELGQEGVLPEVADLVAETLAPLDAQRSLALLRGWQDVVATLDDAEASALLLDTRAHVAAQARLHDVAALLLDEARLAWTVAGDDLRAAEVTDHLGCQLRALGRGEQALARHAEARAVFERLGATEAAAISAVLAGDCCAGLARHDEALAHYRDAHARYRQLDSVHGRARACDRMGIALNHVGRLAASERAHRDAIKGFASLGELEREAQARKNLGWTLGDLGRTGEARTALRDALDVLEAAGWSHAAAEAREGLDRLSHPPPASQR